MTSQQREKFYLSRNRKKILTNQKACYIQY